jgi:hypothetical protein
VGTKAAYGIASLTGNCGESEDMDMNDLRTFMNQQQQPQQEENQYVGCSKETAKDGTIYYSCPG